MKPDERRERVMQTAELVAQVHFGLSAYLDRIDEFVGGFPAGHGSGSGGTGSHSDRTGNAATEDHDDPGLVSMGIFDAAVDKAWRAALDLNGLYVRAFNVAPEAKLAKPGCELCTKIPEMALDPKTRTIRKTGHMVVVTPYPVVHAHVEVATLTRKGSGFKTMGLCHWCYAYQRRVGRLPGVEECRAHAEGRPVKVSA